MTQNSSCQEIGCWVIRSRLIFCFSRTGRTPTSRELSDCVPISLEKMLETFGKTFMVTTADHNLPPTANLFSMRFDRSFGNLRLCAEAKKKITVLDDEGLKISFLPSASLL